MTDKDDGFNEGAAFVSGIVIGAIIAVMGVLFWLDMEWDARFEAGWYLCQDDRGESAICRVTRTVEPIK